MKLEKYKNKNKSKRKVLLISLGIIVLTSVSFLLYKTFASFNEHVEFPIMKGKVDYFGNSDVYFAFYKGDKQLDEMPGKDNEEGLVFIDGECDNGASIDWDENRWAPTVLNLTKTKTKCTLYFNDKYIDRELNGTDPVLNNKLIPIIINEENGKVTRASEKEKWYDYKNQKWANAVILKDGKSDPGAGKEISENDIESYFVWIPRYKYQIFDEGNYNGLTTLMNKTQIINIEFESKDVEPQNGSKQGEWLTHPAFTSFGTNGIWVGKFETGYDGAESKEAALVNPSDANSAIEAAKKVIIKPNVYSWRGIQISREFTVGFNYERDLNSHMMKNTEWGAVAYLQHSKYGSHVKIRINNNSEYLTGYAAIHEPTIGYTATNELCSTNPQACNETGGSEKGVDGVYSTNYFNKASVVASTTNNYSGIFDMAGGAWEYVMAGMDDGTGSGKMSSGRHNIYNSGFNGLLTCNNCDDAGSSKDITKIENGIDLPTDERYFDKYDYNENYYTYSKGILGDATKEVGPFNIINYVNLNTRRVGSWHEEEAEFVSAGAPWIERGSDYVGGTGAGIFGFLGGFGHSSHDQSFRIVLAF